MSGRAGNPSAAVANLTATVAEAANQDHRPYRPVGAALKLIRSSDPEILISGPAGTGKSMAALTKLHACCELFPGCRALMVRKTRASLTESALVSFEQRVVPVGHPILGGASRGMRQSYRYPNGSSIVCGGLDNPNKIFSTEYDLIYVQEAIELTENAWEALTTRLRNNRMHYQQLLADTNPDAPTHWLKRRCDAGTTVMLESRHEDNPSLWDGGNWTPDGLRYLSKLDALTGPRKLRLRHGRWVQAEGVVYDGWDRSVHLIDWFAPPWDWDRFWVIDFGHTAPFVCLFFARDHDGRLYLYREIYHTKRLVEDHARRMLELYQQEARDWAARSGQRYESLLQRLCPRTIICDHDAEDRATLSRHLGMSTWAAHKDVLPGIDAVAARLRRAGDGRPRLFVMRGALDCRDPDLVDAKKPTRTEEEFDCYVWNENALKDEPRKENDHGLDALRYLISMLDLRGAWEAPSTIPNPQHAATQPVVSHGSRYAEGRPNPSLYGSRGKR